MNMNKNNIIYYILINICNKLYCKNTVLYMK